MCLTWHAAVCGRLNLISKALRTVVPALPGLHCDRPLLPGLLLSSAADCSGRGMCTMLTGTRPVVNDMNRQWAL